MARTYKRDSRGRFAGGGGSSSRGGGRKPMQRGTNRLTRDNAGRITSVGGDGATARGGRLRTASGRQRATVTAKGIGKAPAGTVGRSGRVKGAARVKAAAVKSPLRRTGQKIAVPALKTNTERGRRGIVSMSATAKQARRGAVAERKEEKRLRVMERQGGIVARRQGNRLSTYSSSGAFNQAAQNLNQSKLKKSKQIQSWLTTRNPADKPQSRRQKPAAAKHAATAKPASKLGFTQSDFARRSQRTTSIRNPQVKAKAQQLYGKILDLNSTPRQLKSMFKKAGKPKQRTATAATRQMRREHQNMMAASKVLFK